VQGRELLESRTSKISSGRGKRHAPAADDARMLFCRPRLHDHHPVASADASARSWVEQQSLRVSGPIADSKMPMSCRVGGIERPTLIPSAWILGRGSGPREDDRACAGRPTEGGADKRPARRRAPPGVSQSCARARRLGARQALHLQHDGDIVAAPFLLETERRLEKQVACVAMSTVSGPGEDPDAPACRPCKPARPDYMSVDRPASGRATMAKN